MSEITFTKKIGLFQQYIYKFEKDSSWARRADIPSFCFIDVSIREILNEKGEFIRNQLHFETFMKHGHSVCKAIPEDKEAFDAQFFERDGLKMFYVAFEGSMPVYVRKIYDVMETEEYRKTYEANGTGGRFKPVKMNLADKLEEALKIE